MLVSRLIYFIRDQHVNQNFISGDPAQLRLVVQSEGTHCDTESLVKKKTRQTRCPKRQMSHIWKPTWISSARPRRAIKPECCDQLNVTTGFTPLEASALLKDRQQDTPGIRRKKSLPTEDDQLKDLSYGTCFAEHVTGTAFLIG